MKKLIVLALLLSGCASVDQTFDANGNVAYTLNCSGTARGWDKCFAAAGNICGESGYFVLDRTGEMVASSSSTTDSSYSAQSTARSMVITCK